jgi:hypothetical protein
MKVIDYTLPLAGNIKIDQLAFCAWTDKDEDFIKSFLKLENNDWIEDTVTARGTVGALDDATNTAKLLFNYDLEHEVEILRYIDGPNYLQLADMPGGRMCHIGSHFIGDGDAVPRVDAPIIQQLVTQTHTNPFQAEHNRHYRYTIYNTYNRLGLFFKIIERLDR